MKHNIAIIMIQILKNEYLLIVNLMLENFLLIDIYKIMKISLYQQSSGLKYVIRLNTINLN
jgi:hypothetical protein